MRYEYVTSVGVVTFPRSAFIPLGHVTTATPGGTLPNKSGTTLCSSMILSSLWFNTEPNKRNSTSRVTSSLHYAQCSMFDHPSLPHRKNEIRKVLKLLVRWFCKAAPKLMKCRLLHTYWYLDHAFSVDSKHTQRLLWARSVTIYWQWVESVGQGSTEAVRTTGIRYSVMAGRQAGYIDWLGGLWRRIRPLNSILSVPWEKSYMGGGGSARNFANVSIFGGHHEISSHSFTLAILMENVSPSWCTRHYSFSGITM